MKRIDFTSKADWQLFHRAARHVYHNDPHWIEPLHTDVEAIFDPAQNKAMAEGVARAWVATNNQGNPVGRVAAFIDPGRNREMELRIGGIGFFECIDDPLIAGSLLEQAEAFLHENNMQVIDGITNFGERDKFWGLLTKGFEPPLYQENYHPPYYRTFFEERDYQPHEQILTFRGHIDDVPARRLQAIANRASNRYQFTARTLQQCSLEEFAHDFAHVYNVAFAKKSHFKPITEPTMYELLKQMRHIADPQMACVVYQEETPIGFAGFIPDINPFLRQAKGKLNWRTLPGFFWRFRTAKTKPLKGIAFGIDPAWHGKGVFAVLCSFAYHQKNMTKYSEYYLAAIRAHNNIMVRSVKSLGVKIQREHLTMRKVLDPGASFPQHSFVDL